MKKITVCIFIPNIDKNTGGPSRSVPLLARGLSCMGIEVTILTHQTENMNYHLLEGSNVKVDILPKPYRQRDLESYFDSHKFDLLQDESMWILLSHDILRIAKRKQIPYVFVPRGSLEPWSLKQKWLKKKLAMLLYQRRDIEDAACILATADMEYENLRSLGFKNPIAVIPNGIDISEYPCRTNNDKINIKKQILFLSRIHPKKGVELLAEAWKSICLDFPEWKVIVAGNGDDMYISHLKRMLIDQGISQSMEIIPPLFGKDKCNLYQQSSLFILPTFSENFGMVIAEALSCGLPVITTKNAPWKILNDENIGWWIEMSVYNIKQALIEAMSLDSDVLFDMGQHGSKVVNDNFYYLNIAKKVSELYAWILSRDKQPKNFIYEG